MAKCYINECGGWHEHVSGGNDLVYLWAVRSSCNGCRRLGYLCHTGCFLLKAMDSRRQLSRHNARKHPDVCADELFFETESSDMDAQLPHLVVHPIKLRSKVLQEFLVHSITDGMLLALRRFVSSACFSCATLQLDVVEEVPLLETFIVLIVARLVFRIGSVNQALLSMLLSVMVLSRPKIGPSSLPITRAQITRVITNASSRTSMYSTIPTPRPVELRNRHAYLELTEIMGHALGLQPAESIILKKYQRLVNSPRGQICWGDARARLVLPSVRHLNKIVCLLTYWFDGWDPNSSMSKANKSPI